MYTPSIMTYTIAMTPSPTIVFLGTIVASTPVFTAVILGIIFLLLVYQHRRTAIGLLCISIALSATVTALKLLFAVPRPPHPLVEVTGYAFPSGHSAGSMFLAWVAYACMFGIMQLSARYKFLSILLLSSFVALIAYSRLYFQVHTPIEVAAGLIIGTCFGYGFLVFMRYRTPRPPKTPA